MKLNVYLDELDRSARCQSMLKIEFLPTLVNFFKPSKTPPLDPRLGIQIPRAPCREYVLWNHERHQYLSISVSRGFST